MDIPFSCYEPTCSPFDFYSFLKHSLSASYQFIRKFYDKHQKSTCSPSTRETVGNKKVSDIILNENNNQKHQRSINDEDDNKYAIPLQTLSPDVSKHNQEQGVFLNYIDDSTADKNSKIIEFTNDEYTPPSFIGEEPPLSASGYQVSKNAFDICNNNRTPTSPYPQSLKFIQIKNSFIVYSTSPVDSLQTPTATSIKSSFRYQQQEKSLEYIKEEETAHTCEKIEQINKMPLAINYKDDVSLLEPEITDQSITNSVRISL
ncbi:unnamed protein product [Didymodactylos carnosus]|uniref:Uncharacterized protein n=1 Tax=Didymodactylos carnosus TaxID=1234261 RepID=A0A813WNS0_9BILA|nr:unnamed protein product [Didymodactylos carnosus]CAF0860387.1 unnamed protein product [Didymodactylos carnosus]CAF3645263.1 unnamed protein product [Didymodactylos carnosus]CAF3645324.1 unnamed protein product [Didymodactylos carnosus]